MTARPTDQENMLVLRRPRSVISVGFLDLSTSPQPYASIERLWPEFRPAWEAVYGDDSPNVITHERWWRWREQDPLAVVLFEDWLSDQLDDSPGHWLRYAGPDTGVLPVLAGGRSYYPMSRVEAGEGWLEVELLEPRLVTHADGSIDIVRHDITLLLGEAPPCWPWDCP